MRPGLLRLFEYYLRNLINNFDVNNIAIDHRNLLILTVVGRVVINGGFVSVIGRIVRISRVWIIVVYQIQRHSDDNVTPANVVIPCPAKSWSEPQTNQMIAIPIGSPVVAPPPATAVIVPVAVARVRVICENRAVPGPATIRDLVQPLAH